MDVLGADAHVRVHFGQASRTTARLTNGGQITRVTPAIRVRLAMVAASSPASAGVVCIFQLAATITSRMARIMPERDGDHGPESGTAARTGVGRRIQRPPILVGIRRQPFEPFERPLDGRAVGPEALGQLGQARLGCRPRRASATARTVGGSLASRPSAVQDRDRIELPSGPCTDRRAAGWRRLPGALGPIELPAQGPRDLARLDLEERPGRPDPAQEGPDRLAALGRDHATAARTPHEAANPNSQAESSRRLWCVVGSNHELEVGPAAGQAAGRTHGPETCRAARPPGNDHRAAGPFERPDAPRSAPLRPHSETNSQPSDRGFPPDGPGTQACDLGDAIARSGWGRPRPAHRAGAVTRSARPGSTSGPAQRHAVRPAALPADLRPVLQGFESGRGPPGGGIVMVRIVGIDDVLEHEPRDRQHVRWPAQSHRFR